MNKLINDRGVISCKIVPAFNKSKVKINYEIISDALSVEGLSTNDLPSKREANEEFIKLLKSAPIVQPKHLIKTSNITRLAEKTERTKTNKAIEEDHDIKNFTKLYHPIKTEHEEDKPLSDRLRKLGQLCQKMPFERTQKDIDIIHKILRTVTPLSSQVEDDLLKFLSNIIIYENIDESELTFFGNKGFHIILSGKVRPMSSPYLRMIGEDTDKFLNSNGDDKKYPVLNVGECFGTLDEISIENVDCSKLLMSTSVDCCEVLLITTSYYRRIFEKYEAQKHNDKLILLKNQETFSLWPQQALVRIANILSWVVIPANTLICKEDDISLVLGFIQFGSCYVLRKLDVNKTLPSGKIISRPTQVIIGTLEKGQSYGEVSLLDQTPMKHSLLTKDAMKVIQTDMRRIGFLDSDVKLLLRQSCNPNFDNISKTIVENIYMEQKLKKDWVDLKENVISEVLESRGIRPGHGKWNTMANTGNIY